MAHQISQDFEVKKTQQNFNCDQHGKSDVDGEFGRQSAVIANAACQRELHDISDVVEVLEEDFNRRLRLNPEIPMQHSIEYVPPVRSSVETSKFTKASFSIDRLKSSYCWESTRHTVKRKKDDGRHPYDELLTNTRFRPTMLTNEPCTYPPKIPVLADRDAESDDEEDVKEGDSVVVPTATKIWNGWKCSYRQNEPELDILMKRKLFFKTLSKKSMDLSSTMRHHPEPVRRRSIEEIAPTVRASADRKNAKAKKFNQHLIVGRKKG